MLTSKKAWRVLSAGLLLLVALTTAVSADSSSGSTAGLAAPQAWSNTIYYFNAAGSTFTPRDSSTSWRYPGTGCVSAGTGNDVFTLHLDLPQSARIDYLRMYFRDTSASDSRAWVTTYNGEGSFSDLTTVTSTGAGGYGTNLSSFVGHVVDNGARAYVLNWQANQTGASMQLCGLRVAYRVQTQSVFLPVLLRQ